MLQRHLLSCIQEGLFMTVSRTLIGMATAIIAVGGISVASSTMAEAQSGYMRHSSSNCTRGSGCTSTTYGLGYNPNRYRAAEPEPRRRWNSRLLDRQGVGEKELIAPSGKSGFGVLNP
jgi:hypothetical protein